MGLNYLFLHWFSPTNFLTINQYVWILNSPILAGWWFQIVFYFQPENWGRWTHFDVRIFFKGLVGSTTNQTSFHLILFRQDDQIYELEAAELGYSLLHGFLVPSESPGVKIPELGGWCWLYKSSEKNSLG